MSGAEVQLISNFMVSSRLLAARDVEPALLSLLLVGEAPERRVPALAEVGALLAGVMSTQHGGVELTSSGPLTSLVLGAAAGRDAGRVRELLAGWA